MSPAPIRLFARVAAAAALALHAVGAQSQDVIRIGAPLPITGALSPEAKKLQNGMNLWAEVVNKAGYASPVRTPRGRDILAACGQLKSESVKLRASERAPS